MSHCKGQKASVRSAIKKVSKKTNAEPKNAKPAPGPI
jgi:hypothetical protein